ncbi:MAG: glycosyltransferase family 9 protein, partial [Chloroflexi bacterium]|nr:glycosyltransferase family 9 protein [Chloroflexota bacterium]
QIAIVLGALGDFVLTLPLLQALARRGPLAVFSRGPYRSLLPPGLSAAPWVDTDGPVGARLFSPGLALPAAAADLLRGAAVHVFLRGDAALAASLRGAGVSTVTWHDPRPSAPPHILERFFAGAGLTPPPGLLETPAMPRPRCDGAALWIHPGSGSPSKSLDAAAVGAFARWNHATAQRPLWLSFGEADLALVEPVGAALAQAGLAFHEVRCPSLAELRRLLSTAAAAFVGPDTGVTHLAAALGLPTTAVFRATDPALWRPVGAVRVLDWRQGVGPVDAVLPP